MGCNASEAIVLYLELRLECPLAEGELIVLTTVGSLPPADYGAAVPTLVQILAL